MVKKLNTILTEQDLLMDVVLEKDREISLKNKQRIANVPLELVFTTLPYKEPSDPVTWSRKSKEYSLRISSGIKEEPEENKYSHYGIPYGVYPRLLLYYICTEAIKKQTREIFLGNNFVDMFNRIKLTDKKTGGRTINNFKEQAFRLLMSKISLQYEKRTEHTRHLKYSAFQLVKEMDFWEKQEKFQFNLKLSEDFYSYLETVKTIPFDYDILTMLKTSPMLIDIYIFLNYKAYLANQYNKDLFVSYEDLYSYFGSDFSQLKHFKEKLKLNLKKLITIHPSLYLSEIVKSGKDGILILKESRSNVDPKDEQLLLFDSESDS